MSEKGRELRELDKSYIPPLASLGQQVLYYDGRQENPQFAWITEKYDDNRPGPTISKLVALLVFDPHKGLRRVPEVRHKGSPLANYRGDGYMNMGSWDHTGDTKKLMELWDVVDILKEKLAFLDNQWGKFGWSEASHNDLEDRLRVLEAFARDNGYEEEKKKGKAKEKAVA